MASVVRSWAPVLLADAVHVGALAGVVPGRLPSSSSSSSAANDAAILTVHGSGIHVVNLHDHKPVRAWTVRPSVRFAAPATQTRSALAYHALLADRRTVWTWTADALDLDRPTRKTADTDLVAVLPGASSHTVVVVHAADARVALWNATTLAPIHDAAPAAAAAAASAPGTAAVWAAVVHGPRPRVLVVTADGTPSRSLMALPVAAGAPTTAPPHLHIFEIDGDAVRHVASHVLAAPTLAAKASATPAKGKKRAAAPAAVTYVAPRQISTDTDGRTLGILWETGVFSTFVVTDTVGTGPLQPTAVLAFHSKAVVGVAVADSGHALAVLHAESAEHQDLAQIWETVHQTLQADVTLPAASDSDADGTAQTLVTALAGPTGPLAVVAGRAGIFVLTLVLQPASLLSALGRKSASAPILLAESSLLDAPALLVAPSQAALTATTSLDAWASLLRDGDTRERDCLRRLLDTAETADLGAFTDVFFEHLRETGVTVKAAGWPAIEAALPSTAHTNAEARPAAPAAMEVDSASTGKARGSRPHPRGKRWSGTRKVPAPVRATVSYHFAKQVLGRVLNETAFWAEDVIACLLLTDAVSHTSVPVLVPKLIEHQSIELLELVLRHVSDLPETMVTAILHFALDPASEAAFTAYVARKHARSAEEGSEDAAAAAVWADAHPRDAFVYLIVAAQRNNVFMQTCLRTLHATEALTLVRILVRLLARLRDATERSVGRRLGARVPPLSQAVEWLGLLIDAHFSTLILTPDAHSMLSALRSVLADHLSICRASSQLKGYLTVLAQRTALVSRPDTGDYQIQVLHL